MEGRRLVPVVGKNQIDEGGSIFVLRQERRGIGACLDAIDRKIQVQNPETDLEEAAFVGGLEGRNMTEAQVPLSGDWQGDRGGRAGSPLSGYAELYR